MIDEARFRAFYQEFYPRLWNYVHRLVEDRSACDDIVQESFLRFLRAAPAGLDESGMKSYVFKISTNLARDRWRSKFQHEAWLVETAGADDSANSQVELRMDLNAALGQLSPGQRSMVWLAYVEGYDHREIGGMMGIKPESVRVLLMRARKRLATVLSERSTLDE